MVGSDKPSTEGTGSDLQMYFSPGAWFISKTKSLGCEHHRLMRTPCSLQPADMGASLPHGCMQDAVPASFLPPCPAANMAALSGLGFLPHAPSPSQGCLGAGCRVWDVLVNSTVIPGSSLGGRSQT